jgi:glycosyltransferase involved in cell wall biosynthesis
LRDATQIAILEPLSRGLPVVSTRVGDAPRHYIEPSLQRFCVEPANVDASAAAILELSSAYERWREEFADNGRLLRARHREGRASLASLVESSTSSAVAARAEATPVDLHPDEQIVMS